MKNNDLWETENKPNESSHCQSLLPGETFQGVAQGAQWSLWFEEMELEVWGCHRGSGYQRLGSSPLRTCQISGGSLVSLQLSTDQHTQVWKLPMARERTSRRDRREAILWADRPRNRSCCQSGNLRNDRVLGRGFRSLCQWWYKIILILGIALILPNKGKSKIWKDQTVSKQCNHVLEQNSRLLSHTKISSI